MMNRQVEHIVDRIAQSGTVTVFLFDGRLRVLPAAHERVDTFLRDRIFRDLCVGTYDKDAKTGWIESDLRATARGESITTTA